MRNLRPAALFALMFLLAGNAFAAPAVVRSSLAPNPGVLALLGGGLVGLAALIRHHLSE